MKHAIFGLVFFFLLATMCMAAAGPVVHFSDLTDGVTSGGHWGGAQEGKGAAVSIWGRNFGSARDTATVTVCGVTLDADTDFAEWGATAQPVVPLGMQRITFYLNAAMPAGPGTIHVTTPEGDSNTIPFYCRDSGRIFFLDPASGDDDHNGLYPTPGTGRNGPKQTTAWARGNLEAGDVIYLRDGVYTQHDVGVMYHYGSLFSFGSPGDIPNHHNGTENNSIAVTAYPGEDVRLEAKEACGAGACLNRCIGMFYAGTQLNYWTFSKLTMTASESAVQLGGTGYVDGGTQHIRLINIDATTIYHADILNGCIFSLYGSANNMEGMKVLGCYLHDQLANTRGQIWEDVNDEERAYQVYVGGYGRIIDMEFGWNDMGWGSMGRGLQIYGHLPDDSVDGLKIHDNWFHHNRRQAVILGGGDGGAEYEFVKTAYVYNNILSHSGWPTGDTWATFVVGGISWGRHGGEFHVYNNIIDGSGLAFPPMHMTGQIKSINLQNNIILAQPNGYDYYTHFPDTPPSNISASHNLYYRAGERAAPSWDTGALNAIDSIFVENAPQRWSDYYLKEGSAAIDAGTADSLPMSDTDFLGKPRPMDGNDSGQAAVDIGPFEYNGAYTPPPQGTDPGNGPGSSPNTGSGSGGCFIDMVLM